MTSFPGAHRHAALTVQGNSISVGTTSALAAIDTGTTLIGGPTAIVASIWAQVPGSMELTGQYQGLYAFRQCHLRIGCKAGYSSTPSLQYNCYGYHLLRWNQLGDQPSGHESRHYQRRFHFSDVRWRYLRSRYHRWRWCRCTCLDCR